MADLRAAILLEDIERELAFELRPVHAPEALWDRIQQPRVRAGRGRRLGFEAAAWAFAAAVALVVFVFSGALAGLGMERLAGREVQSLADGSVAMDFRSSDPANVRTWVKKNANLDVNFPAGRAEILGVRLTRLFGTPVAVIVYQVRGDLAALLVSRVGISRIGSRAHPTRPARRLFAWSSGNQLYAVALSGTQDPRGACALCHVQTSF